MHQFVHIGFGYQLAAVPITAVQQEASETGHVAGRGMEAAEGFLIAVFLVEQPIGITFGLHRTPELLFGIVA